MSELPRILGEIKDWAEANAPDAVLNLNFPIEQRSLWKLKFALPPSTPSELFELLLIHDGEGEDSWQSLLPDSMQLMSGSSILEQYLHHLKTPDELPEKMAQYVKIGHYRVLGPVHPVSLHSLRVPFAARNAEIFWMIDLIPGEGGKFGQIIQEDIEDGSWKLVADSLVDLFDRYLTELRAGAFNINEYGRICNDAGGWPN